MENTVCGSDNPSQSENANLNEATPAVAPILTSDAPQDAGSTTIIAEECDDAISSTTPDKFTEDIQPASGDVEPAEESSSRHEADTDFFTSELCISDVPTEKITENVEDIVQDLENLLGEPLDNSKVTESYNEVNSSNVEDIIQGSDLCQVEQINSESTTVDCGILPEIGVVTSESNENQPTGEDIHESVLIEVAKAAEESELNQTQTVDEVSEVIKEFDPNETQEGSEISSVIKELDPSQTQEDSEVSAAIEQLNSTQTQEVAEISAVIKQLDPSQTHEDSEISAVIEQLDTSQTQEVSETAVIKQLDLSRTQEDSEISTVIKQIDPIQTLEVSEISEVIKELVPNQIPEDSAISEVIKELDSDNVSESPIKIVEDTVLEATNIIEATEQVSTNSDESGQPQTEETIEIVQDDYTSESNLETLQAIAAIEESTHQSFADIIEHEMNIENTVESTILPETEEVSHNQEMEQLIIPTDVEQNKISIQSDETVSEVLEDLLKESNSANIDEECSESLCGSEDILRHIAVNEQEQDYQEENVTETVLDLNEKVNVAEKTESLSTESNASENVLNVNEQVDSLSTEPDVSENISKNEQMDAADTKPNVSENMNTVDTEPTNNMTEQLDTPSVEPNISVSQQTSEELPETLQSVVENIIQDTTEDNAEKSNEQTEQVIIVQDAPETIETQNQKEEEENQHMKEQNLSQPLTVEVEDPAFEENPPPHEQNVEKNITSEDLKVSEIAQITESSSGSADSEDNQEAREPLKMTITKHKSDNTHSILKIYDPNDADVNQEQEIPKLVIRTIPSSTTSDEQSTSEEPAIPKITIKSVPTPPETQYSPKLTIKPIKPPDEELVVSSGSPKITIKPVVKPESLSPIKLTIRPYPKLEELQCSPKLNIKPVIRPVEEASSDTHYSPKITIKPIVKSPEESEERSSPRITIKPIIKPQEEEIQSCSEEKHSPRITIKPLIKPVEEEEERHSPRITIKPVVKPLEEYIKEEEKHSPRITIKPVVRPPEESLKEEVSSCNDEKHSPRITIKPVVRPSESLSTEEVTTSSPKITIKPVIKPPEESSKEEVQSCVDEGHSPRITIKPILKPPESETESVHSPRITIKPIIKPQEHPKEEETHLFKLNIKPVVKPPESSLSSKITIKPVTKPSEPETEPIELIDFEEQIKQERIVLKIAKNTKRAAAASLENEKLKKIKLKLSKGRGMAHIVQTTPEALKRTLSGDGGQEPKHFKTDLPPDLSISMVPNTASRLGTSDLTITRVDDTSSNTMSDNIEHEELTHTITPIPLVPPEHKKDAIPPGFNADEIPDPLAEIPVFEITLESATASKPTTTTPALAPAAGVPPAPAPRKRGRPRKVPLEVREEFKDPKEEETPPPPVEESTRPKRSCRGASIAVTLGIKPRKPRAPSTRGRGRGRGSRGGILGRPAKRPIGRPRLNREPMVKEQSAFKEFDAKDAEFKQVPLPLESGNREVVIYEEETRMSAENSSRAQTPAKQVLAASAEVVEESQSSVQSNTTTESGEKTQKTRKGPRLEVHQEPEGEVISADKLAEYCWGGGGPYMLQEQVAQFLGIKSFKRKYPGIQRRPVDMQERDFIRESCLASEAMCDMGLTAVRSEDILDIMYTDFQHKYEEYCKHQRDRQAKDVSNKQKALSLAASQEKNKLDIVEQAVQSAFQWNANFNKARREQRRACMDLQTFTVHFPKGKMKQVNKPPVGNYPLALVPGQFTDYYKKYTPLELSNLPLNTTGCKTVSISSINQDTEDSQSDGSGSDSDSSSSDSDSSYSGSSEDCKMCNRHPPSTSKKLMVH